MCFARKTNNHIHTYTAIGHYGFYFSYTFGI